MKASFKSLTGRVEHTTNHGRSFLFVMMDETSQAAVGQKLFAGDAIREAIADQGLVEGDHVIFDIEVDGRKVNFQAQFAGRDAAKPARKPRAGKPATADTSEVEVIEDLETGVVALDDASLACLMAV